MKTTGNWAPSNISSRTAAREGVQTCKIREIETEKFPNHCYMSSKGNQFLFLKQRRFPLLTAICSSRFPIWGKASITVKENIKKVTRHWTQIALSSLVINFSKMKTGNLCWSWASKDRFFCFKSNNNNDNNDHWPSRADREKILYSLKPFMSFLKKIAKLRRCREKCKIKNAK